MRLIGNREEEDHFINETVCPGCPHEGTKGPPQWDCSFAGRVVYNLSTGEYECRKRNAVGRKWADTP